MCLNASFRDSDLLGFTQCRVASNFSDAELDTYFTQHMSFYLTSYVTDVWYYSPTVLFFFFSSTFINRSIDILLEFWRFYQSC